MKLNVSCWKCDRGFTFNVSVQGYDRWLNGELIQKALPEIGADNRELLISRTCGECWDALYPNWVEEKNREKNAD